MHLRKFTFPVTAVIAFVLGVATVGYTQEPHPQIRAAQRALENALNHLQKSDRDFGGHRTKAVEHIHAAQAELNQALAADPK